MRKDCFFPVISLGIFAGLCHSFVRVISRKMLSAVEIHGKLVVDFRYLP